MKIRLPRLFKEKDPKDPKTNSKVGQIAKQVFGFTKVDKEKYRKSPELDEDMVIAALTKLETDANWIKRILWLVVAGSIAGRFLGN